MVIDPEGIDCDGCDANAQGKIAQYNKRWSYWTKLETGPDSLH